LFPLSLALCSITLARQDRAHNVNLAEVDGGYASGIKNLCSLNFNSKFRVGGTKKRLASSVRGVIPRTLMPSVVASSSLGASGAMHLRALL
jgi:hypothetical protein